MTLRKRIQIIEEYDSENSDTDDNEEVMHVLPQSFNPNDVCINADMIPAHHELEVDDRWGPIQLSNYECEVNSTTNQTSEASSQVIGVPQRPEVQNQTSLTELSSPVLSTSKPWGKLAQKAVVEPDSILSLTAAYSNDEI